MTKSHQQKLQLTAKLRRPQVAKMYLDGKSQHAIAKAFKVSQNTIFRDLQAIQEGWLERALVPYSEAIAAQLARLDWLEQEAIEAWIASKKGKATKRIDSEGGTVETYENKPGDPVYLDQIQKVVDKRMRIFGVKDTPLIEFNQTNNTQNNITGNIQAVIDRVWGDE